jgi:molybdopterin-guanine dinucleotide biosynthesis protein A
MENDHRVAGAVLAGGESLRMGVDKATMLVDGGFLIEKPLKALEAAGVESRAIIGGSSEVLKKTGSLVVPDRWPQQGPLGGILSALHFFKEQKCSVIVLACDLVLANENEIARLIQQAELFPHTVVVPEVQERRQWMHACWPPEALPHLEKAFSDGERAPFRAVHGFPVTSFKRDGNDFYKDLDQPSDLLAATDGDGKVRRSH